MKAVIDTNVLLVANGQHADVSPDCVAECVRRLQSMMQKASVTVVDDGYRILGEYQHKTRLNPPKGAGDVFLKWLLRQSGTGQMEQVMLNETAADCFAEFPDKALEPNFDAPDRKFAAVASAHPDRPEIWQAVDCKWLDWWLALQAKGVQVKFLCPDDACSFYRKKFPHKPEPTLPG